MDIKKEITLKRLGNLLIYFANNTENCGVTKANKLLYYLDCYHLVKYGRKVLKDSYVKDQQGPVPIDAYRQISSIDFMKEIGGQPDEFLANFIDIEIQHVYDYLLHRIIAKQEFEPKWFSKSELEILKNITEEFKYSTAKELSIRTHNEPPYLSAESMGDEVDLKLFAKGRVSEDQFAEIIRTEKEIKAMDYNYQ